MLGQLVDQGNTVVVIEHNLDVIQSPTTSSTSGPRAARAAAGSIAQGTPEEVASGPGIGDRAVPGARSLAPDRANVALMAVWLAGHTCQRVDVARKPQVVSFVLGQTRDGLFSLSSFYI